MKRRRLIALLVGVPAVATIPAVLASAVGAGSPFESNLGMVAFVLSLPALFAFAFLRDSGIIGPGRTTEVVVIAVLQFLWVFVACVFGLVIRMLFRRFVRNIARN